MTENEVSIIEIISIILGLWGTILSTILGIQKFILEKKKIRITLTELVYAAEYKLSIVNIGHRPVTIVDINFRMDPYGEKIPSNSRFKRECKLPITLTDGGMPAEFILTDTIFNEIYYLHNELKMTVFDTESNSYSKYKKESFDEKFSSKEAQ